MRQKRAANAAPVRAPPADSSGLSRRGHILLNGAFALTGAITNLLGPLLLLLIARQGITEARAGRLFLAQFTASSAGALSLGWIGKRIAPQFCLALSFIGMGAAVIALGFAGPVAVFVWLACCGFAIGVNNPVANLIAARGSPGNETAALNLLSMCWSAGAVIAPPLLTWLVDLSGPEIVLSSLGSLAVLAGMLLWIPQPAEARSDRAARSEPAPAVALSAAWLTGVFLFLYIGAESTASGWLPAYSWRAMGFASRFAGITQAVFWAAVLGGRLVASLRSQLLSPRQWMAWGLASAIFGNVALVTARGPVAAIGGALLSGVGMAPLFPTAVAMFEEKSGRAAMRLTGYIFAGAGLGGAVIPWLAGVLSSTTGNLRAAMLVSGAAAVLMAFIATKL